MEIYDFTMNLYDDVYTVWEKAGIGVGSSDSHEQITQFMLRNPNTFLVGKYENHVIAVILGGSDARRGYVHHLAVDPEYQGKGYGKMILTELIKRFKALHLHKIHLFVDKTNEKVFGFYKKMQWVLRDDLIMMSFVPDSSLYFITNKS
jgi:N-acetylglutamate synthase